MNTEWPEVRLADYASIIAGFAFKSSGFTERLGDVPLVKGSVVQQGYIDWANAPRWPIGDLEHLGRYELSAGDVVLAMDRPWVDAGLKYGWIRATDPRCFLVQRVARLRGSNGLFAEFLRYIIGSPAFTDYIRPIVTGVNVPHISGSQVGDFRFRLPPETVQRRIADILSAYDDLIENNTRRIAILEEMAQAIYREWFVDFRFPGHEQAEMVESELGPVPAGWERVPLSGIASHVRVNVQPGDHPDEVFAHFSIPAFDTDRRPALEEGATISSTKHVVQQGAVLLSKLNPRIPRVWLPFPPSGFRAICSTEFVVLHPRGVAQSFLYGVLSSSEFLGRLAARAGGTSTSHQRVKPNDLLSMAIVRPSEEVSGGFVRVTEPIHVLIENLRQKNDILRRTRDLLLPKLISGEIEVEAMDEALACHA